MSEDIFRIVVTAGVAVAAIAFVAQAAILFALYGAVRKMQRKTEPLIERAGPVVERLGPAIDKLQLVLEKAGPVLEKAGPVLDRAVPVVEKAGPVVERAGKLLETAQAILNDNRANISGVSSEALVIARTGREQAEQLGELLSDASLRARQRMEQINQSVDNTVEQVEQVGDAIKRAALRPVREVNGLAAGISAAVATLVHGRKYPVDHATLDEEMFI